MRVADYFAPFNIVALSAADKHLGSGGGLVLPDMTDSFGRTRHLTVSAGKDGSVYVVNGDNMGEFNPAAIECK